MMVRAAVLIGSVLVLASTCSAQRTVRVRLDPSLIEPIRVIAAEFKKTHKDAELQLGLTGTFDVSLGPSVPGQMLGKRLFALDRMVVVAPSDPARVTKFAHIGLNLKLAVPTSATLAGKHAATVLDQASSSYGRDWAANVKRNTKLAPTNAEEAIELVISGQADAAVVNATAADKHAAKLRIIPIPADLDEPIELHGVAKSDTLPQAFLEYLFTKGNQQRLGAAGFSSPIAPSSDIAVIKPGSMMRLFTAALGTLKQETVKVDKQSFKGASLSSIVGSHGSEVTIVGADGTSVAVPLRTLSRSGGVLFKMGDGNYRAILPGRSPSEWVRWVRRIEVK